MASWSDRKAIEKNEDAFANFLAQRQLAAAVEFYEKNLSQFPSDVSKPLRAAYHLCRWLTKPSDDNFIYLWDLAAQAPKSGQVARAGAAAYRLRRHLELAYSLRRRDADGLDQQPGSAADDTDAPSAAMERLAAAVLECSRPATNGGASDPAALARRVLAVLPDAAALPTSSLAHARLMAWALLTTGQAQRLCGNEPALAAFPDDERKRVRTAAALAWGKSAVAAGNLQGATAALKIIAELGDATARDRALLDWGTGALAHQPDNAIKWFAAQRGEAGAASPPILFALALASFKVGRHAEARELLETLKQAAPGEALQYQTLVLSILSHLASTREWAAPSRAQHAYLTTLGLPASASTTEIEAAEEAYRAKVSEDYKATSRTLNERKKKKEITKEDSDAEREKAEAEANHKRFHLSELKRDYQSEPADIAGDGARQSTDLEDLKVKNRALWNGVKAKIAPLIEQLAAAPPQWSWWGPYITGLIAYVDRNATLDPDAIARFVAAAEHVQSATARNRLREIEAILTSRANAVQRTTALIREKRYPELREFAATVLAHFAESIPSNVRAVVHVALWSEDRSYDPLPALRQIPTGPANEGLIADCIAEVTLFRAVGQLAADLQSRSSAAPPALDQFAGAGPDGMRLAALAGAVAHIRNGANVLAASLLDQIPDDTGDPLVAYLRFYVLWRQGDSRGALAILDRSAGNPFLQRLRPEDRAAVRTRALIQALEGDRLDEALDLLKSGSDVARPQVLSMLTGFVLWLMRDDKPLLARKLILRLRRDLPPEAAGAAGHNLYSLHWGTLALETFVTAQLAQYTACIESAESIIGASPPGRPAFGRHDADNAMLAWCKLLRIEAELALSTTTADAELKMRWRSLRRALEDRATELANLDRVRPYALLISGLLSALSSDMMVDQATLDGLARAQRELSLDHHASFLEHAIGKSQWRYRVLADFWEALRGGNVTRGRLIYHEELLPAFGERVPRSVQLGMIVADWGAGAAAPAELMRRLELLEYEAADLPADVISRVRNYINDGERIREITRLLQEQKFDVVVDLIDRTAWSDMKAGEMPVAVAVAQLYAYFKTRNTDVAERFATDIIESKGLAEWVRDDGALLLGYVFFDKREYPNAVKAFQRTSQSTVLGHNVDRYCAAAQFNEGLQLLEVDNKDKAFGAFSRALSERGSTGNIANLAPLFLHFGLKSIESRNGTRARQAFALADESIGDPSASPRVARNKLLAELGTLLCQALMDEDVESLAGDKFLDLRKRAQKLPPIENVSPTRLDRTLIILAICQELRRQLRLPERQRMSPKKLAGFVREQADALEALTPQAKEHDPLIWVIKGVVDLLLVSGGRTTATLDKLEGAFRLGLQSSRLAKLLEEQRDLLKQANAQTTKGLDLLDVYLASGEIPQDLADEMNRNDGLTELYRLERGYVPADIRTDEQESSLAKLIDRLKALHDYAKSEQLRSNRKLSQLGDQLGALIETITATEAKLSQVENQMMQEVAAILRTQTFEHS